MRYPRLFMYYMHVRFLPKRIIKPRNVNEREDREMGNRPSQERALSLAKKAAFPILLNRLWRLVFLLLLEVHG